MQNHLLKTHLVMEPIAIALYRNVSRVHPVFKLLIPHVRYTIAINTIGRRGLIGENGLADKVLAIGKGGHIQLIMSKMQFLKKYCTPLINVLFEPFNSKN